MKKPEVFFCLFVVVFALESCSVKRNLQVEKGDIRVEIRQGEAWVHKFPLFAGISVKTRPQMAIWIEDTAGNYVSTLFVSKKVATQGWLFSRGSRRQEALPYWEHKRGIQYVDGLYLPTKDNPIPDGITGATPKAGFSVDLKTGEKRLQKFIVVAEFNQSADYNDFYKKTRGINKSGQGENVSGQPAVVYKVKVDLQSGAKVFPLTLVGHSSEDGSDGNLYTDLSHLTTAKDIVRIINVNMQ